MIESNQVDEKIVLDCNRLHLFCLQIQVDYFTLLGPRLNDATGLPALEEAGLLVRYPLEDRPEQPLPQKVSAL